MSDNQLNVIKLVSGRVSEIIINDLLMLPREGIEARSALVSEYISQILTSQRIGIVNRVSEMLKAGASIEEITKEIAGA